MGRRRRKVVKIVRRKLPDFYLCPRCGKNTVKATINKKLEQIAVVCGNCGLKNIFNTKPQMEGVDAYCLFVDSYYGVETKEEAAVG